MTPVTLFPPRTPPAWPTRAATAALEQTATLASPRLWSIESPALYTLRTRVLDGTTVRDETLTPFGVRTFAFDPDHGFTLNGKPMKLKGVCLHHDGGSVGSASPPASGNAACARSRRSG